MIKIKESVCLISLIAVLAVCGCMGSSLNSNSPDYIKTVSAIKEGDGVRIYFILADKDGQETTSDGYFEADISSALSSNVYYFRGNITKSDFQKVKLGIGSFEHEAIIYNVGRASNEKMGRIAEASSGKVTVRFTTPDNRTLEGEDAVYF
jgi:hypothetical protein